MVSKKFFLTCGSGKDKDSLVSFGIALEDAGIEKFNIVPVPNIIPPKCKLINKEEGLKLLSPGQIIHCVLSENQSQEKELISAGIGIAFPEIKGKVGCIFEHTSIGKEESIVAKEVEKKARELLKKKFEVKTGKSLSIVKEAQETKNIWTTVVAVAVFI